MGVEISHSMDDSGQSVVEFLFLLPMMLGLVILLLRVNTAIQSSIVNQQYARAQAHWLTFNSPVYPEIRLRTNSFVTDRTRYNRMVIGVSENSTVLSEDQEQRRIEPEASTQLVTRDKRKAGGEGEAQTEPTERGVVRIRTTVALCTQSNLVNVNGTWVPIELGTDGSLAKLGEISDPSVFQYCRSPLDE